MYAYLPVVLSRPAITSLSWLHRKRPQRSAAGCGQVTKTNITNNRMIELQSDTRKNDVYTDTCRQNMGFGCNCSYAS